MSAEPYNPTPEQLVAALDHVHYEIQQLTAVLAFRAENPVLRNLLLECALLHIRALKDFFARADYHHDDVLATHFEFALSPAAIAPEWSDRLNKDLAHLTYSRTLRTASSKEWPLGTLADSILTRSHEFVHHVLATRTVFAERGVGDWKTLESQVAAALRGIRRSQAV